MNSSKPKNAGLEAIGFGFYHTGLELWGKEISFGHSKKYTSGVFAVKPRAADTLMPQTRYRESVEIATILISRYRYRRKIYIMTSNVTRRHLTTDACPLAQCRQPPQPVGAKVHVRHVRRRSMQL
jgi:hypothetical protein